MATQVYPSDLNDDEWALLAPLIPPAKPGGQPCSVDIHRILNGLFYLLRTGCAWRYLPREYGPWQTIYHYFRQWRLEGTWANIHTQLRELARLHASRGDDVQPPGQPGAYLRGGRWPICRPQLW